jgi:hypothetical protein
METPYGGPAVTAAYVAALGRVRQGGRPAGLTDRALGLLDDLASWPKAA